MYNDKKFCHICCLGSWKYADNPCMCWSISGSLCSLEQQCLFVVVQVQDKAVLYVHVSFNVMCVSVCIHLCICGYTSAHCVCVCVDVGVWIL